MRFERVQSRSDSPARIKPGLMAVVTGVSGFIGRAVCEELLARGAVVLGISRTRDEAIAGASCQRVRDYADTPAPPGAVCIHLAGASNAQEVGAHVDDERETALRIAGRLATGGFARVVYASSAQVYGDGVSTPRREHEAVAPTGPYAMVKRAAEEVFLSQGHAVARIANTYGPGMSSANVLSDLLRQIPGHGEVRVRDTGPVRDYIHVRDVARGLADLACGAAPGVYNLGTGMGTSVGDLATLLLCQAGEEGRRVVPLAPSQRLSWLVLDPAAMTAACAWHPAIRLAQGLKDLLAHRESALAR